MCRALSQPAHHGQITLVGSGVSNLQFVNTIHDFPLFRPSGVTMSASGRALARTTWRGNRFYGCDVYGLTISNWGAPTSSRTIGSAGRRREGIRCRAVPGTIVIRNNSFSAQDGLTTDGSFDFSRYTISGNIFGTTQIFSSVLYRGGLQVQPVSGVEEMW